MNDESPRTPPAKGLLIKEIVKSIAPSSLTFLGLGVLGLIVYETMRYVTSSLHMDRAYWLVPVFGALGGAVGAVVRNARELRLCHFESASRVDLGVLEDIALGLGGASAVMFLFAGTLRLNPSEPDSHVVLISVTFIAGASGKRILEIATKKLEKIAYDAAEKAAAHVKEEVLTGTAAAENFTQNARRKIDSALFQEGLELAEKAIRADRRFVRAYIEKGRALKRLGRLDDALSTIQYALRIEPNNARLLYNRACYHCLTGKPVEEVLKDLARMREIMPILLYEDASRDQDFQRLKDDPVFKDLITQPA
jgi:tetratricopeptide (TPR) repeat protein